MSSNEHEQPEGRIARAVAAGMYDNDRAARAAGIKIEDVGPDYARVRMTVREDMLNSHDICHGGFVFLLADTAFAYACNSRNASTLALSCTVSFTKATEVGEVLVAEGRAAHQAGRTGIYDVSVTDEKGDQVALFRGQSYRVRGETVPGLNAELGLETDA